MPKIKNHALEEYYHIYNRGMQKQSIFETDKDRLRFLFLILTFQGKKTIPNISRTLKQFVVHPIQGSVQSSTLNISTKFAEEILENRIVELISFCLMPNHFHLQLKEKVEGGIAKYMQRVLTSYTNYFNIRHKKSGHLFQGSYKSILMENDIQLMHTSAYIHKNPSKLTNYKEKYEKYAWSSFQDYIALNRFNKLLSTDMILDHYKNNETSLYKNFVKTSLIKEKI